MEGPNESRGWLPRVERGEIWGVSQQKALDLLVSRYPDCVSRRDLIPVCASRGGAARGKAVERLVPGLRRALHRRRAVDRPDAAAVVLRSAPAADDRLHALACVPYTAPGSRPRSWEDARRDLKDLELTARGAAAQAGPESARRWLEDAPAKVARILAALRPASSVAGEGARPRRGCPDVEHLPLLMGDACEVELFRPMVAHLHQCGECLDAAGSALDRTVAGMGPHRSVRGAVLLGLVLLAGLGAFWGGSSRGPPAEPWQLARDAYRRGDWAEALPLLEGLARAPPRTGEYAGFTFGYWLATIRLSRDDGAAALQAARWAHAAAKEDLASTGQSKFRSVLVGTLLLQARCLRHAGGEERREEALVLEARARDDVAAITDPRVRAHAAKRITQYSAWLAFQGDPSPQGVRSAIEALLATAEGFERRPVVDPIARADLRNTAARASLMAWQLWEDPGDLGRARVLLTGDQVTPLPRGEALLRAWRLEAQGLLALAEGSIDRPDRLTDAVRALEASLTTYRIDAGHPWGLSSPLRNLAIARAATGDTPGARAAFAEAAEHAGANPDLKALVAAAQFAHLEAGSPGARTPWEILDDPSLGPLTRRLAERWLQGGPPAVLVHVPDFDRLPVP